MSKLPSCIYRNMVHGNTPDEVKQDAEGLQIMRYGIIILRYRYS